MVRTMIGRCSDHSTSPSGSTDNGNTVCTVCAYRGEMGLELDSDSDMFVRYVLDRAGIEALEDASLN